MAGGSAQGGRSVASRVTAILMVFRSGGTHSLSELASLTGLPISTTHRLVGELVGRRVLERTNDGYRVGLPLRMIGAGAAHQPPPLLERGLAVITDVAEATHATVRMGVLSGFRLAVATAAPGRPLCAGFAEDVEPVHTTALGRALLAFSPAGVVDHVLAQARHGDGPVVSPDQLRRTLATIRRTRVAVRRQAHGAFVLAVPVFGTGGTVLAALEAAVAPVAPVSDVRGGFQSVRGALLVSAGSLSREMATAGPMESAPGGEPAAEPARDPRTEAS